MEEGRRLIVQAAHQGHGAAAHFVSLMTAIDPANPSRWSYALAYLGRAAKAGHIESQAELAFLAGDEDTASALENGKVMSADIWHRLHDAVDVAALMATPAPRIAQSSPSIAIVERFLSPRVCDWIIRRAGPRLKRAQTYNPRTGAALVDDRRTNSEMRFLFPEMDLVILATLHRISGLCNLPVNGMEPTSVLHYTAGQQYRPHYDFLDPRVPSYDAEVTSVGQRQVTFLIFLNEDFEGGETDFPLIGYSFKGRKGDAIMFRNVGQDGAPDYNTLHAGLPPISGEKWLLSQWIRGKSQPKIC
jgi:hypothetical protein